MQSTVGKYVQLLDPNFASRMNNGTHTGGLAYALTQGLRGFEVGNQRREDQLAKEADQKAFQAAMAGFQGKAQPNKTYSDPTGAPLTAGGTTEPPRGFEGMLAGLEGLTGPRAQELAFSAMQGAQQTQAQRAAQERADRQRQEDIERQNKQWEASYGLDQQRLNLASQPKQTPETFGSTPVQVMDPNTGKPTMVLVGNRGTIRSLGYDAAPPPAFEGHGMEAQDRNVLIQYKQMMDSGQPIDPQMEMAAKMAYGRLSQGRTQNMPDGSVVYIPGADLAGMGLANPNQQASMPSVGGLNQSSAQPSQGAQMQGTASLEALLAVQERSQRQAAPFMQQQTPQPMPQQADAIPGVPGSRVISEAKDQPLTVGQSKAATFSDRMAEADKILSDEKMIGAMVDPYQNTVGGLPGVGNFIASPEYQMVDQAKRNFINALLRDESGAVIADSEFENADRQYFPQPGDSPAVIAQKAQNRRTVIDGMRRAAGPGGQPQAQMQTQGVKRYVYDPVLGELVERAGQGQSQNADDPLGILGGTYQFQGNTYTDAELEDYAKSRGLDPNEVKSRIRNTMGAGNTPPRNDGRAY
jgi:hypothetical protein